MTALKGFAYPDFQPGPRGYLETKEGVAVITANIKTAILTSKGERVNNPDFGSDLEKKLFGANTTRLHDEIRSIVIETIEKWDAYTVVKDVTVGQPSTSTLNSGEDPGHIVYISITYSPKTDLSTTEAINILLPIS